MAEVVARDGNESKHTVGRKAGNRHDLLDVKPSMACRMKASRGPEPKIAQSGSDQP